MSVDIIYKVVGLVVEPKATGLTFPLYILAEQVGDSRTYEYGKNGNDGRRARRWYINCAGSIEGCMETVIRTAAHCGGSMIHLDHYGKETTPESYIAKLRKALANATPYQGLYWLRDGYMSVGVRDPDAAAPFEHQDMMTSTDSMKEFLAQDRVKEALLTPAGQRFFSVRGPDLRR